MAYGIKKDNTGLMLKSYFKASVAYAAIQRKIDRRLSKMTSQEKISHYKCEVWVAFILTLLIAFSGLKGWFYWWLLFVGIMFTSSAINKLVDSGYK